jgi:hypothetical protein
VPSSAVAVQPDSTAQPQLQHHKHGWPHGQAACTRPVADNAAHRAAAEQLRLDMG